MRENMGTPANKREKRKGNGIIAGRGTQCRIFWNGKRDGRGTENGTRYGCRLLPVRLMADCPAHGGAESRNATGRTAEDTGTRRQIGAGANPSGTRERHGAPLPPRVRRLCPPCPAHGELSPVRHGRRWRQIGNATGRTVEGTGNAGRRTLAPMCPADRNATGRTARGTGTGNRRQPFPVAISPPDTLPDGDGFG